MRHLWLPHVARQAGLTVVEHTGWASRGQDAGDVRVIVAHHTATPAVAPGDLPTLDILLHGRPDLPGPLCHYGLSRSGVVHVIAAGKANHAGKGRWASVTTSINTLGIEAEHSGVGPWPAVQLDAYDRLVAAILRHCDLPVARFCGHKEWALPPGRKTDPSFDMAAARRRVGLLLDTATSPNIPAPKEDRVLIRIKDKPTVYELCGSWLFYVSGAAFKARGLKQTDVVVVAPDDPRAQLPVAKIAQ